MRWAFAVLPFHAPFPDAVEMQRHPDGDWTDPSWIETHLWEQGFKDVKVALIEGTYRISGVEEFIQSFWMMMVWMMNAYWDEETRAAHPPEEVEGLVRRSLEERNGGEGWDIQYALICMTGKVEK